MAVALARRLLSSPRGGRATNSNSTVLTTTTLAVPKTPTRPFTMTLNHSAPSNVGGVGLAAQDAAVGAQAREPLTFDGIRARREKAGKLVAPTASYSDSDMFKSPQAYDKPKAKRWDHLLSPESRARKPCVLKLAAKHLKKPGLVSLGGGLPHADNFPFEALTLKVPTAPDFNGLKDITMGKHDVTEQDGVFDLAIALNYAQSIGSAQLVRWVTEHSELVHRPPYADWRCALTIGSTGSLEVAYRMFGDRARGDSLLTEAFSFSTALETAAPLGLRVFGVDMDEQGLRPDSMDDLLTNWDEAARGARRPRLLYTVPSGQNPTGATQSEARRRAIYDVCRRHDVFILEDEPYYFLQMQPYGTAAAESSPTDPQAFLDGLVPSLLSMDVDGRVMRHDSFSKVVVPGSRIGWITASEQVVERYIRHAECCSQGPSGFSQAALYKLLDEEWGHEGYIHWLMHVRSEYARRRDALLAACEKHLPRDVVTWTPPAAGMFLWLQVDHTKHPHVGTRTLLEIEEEIYDACIDKGVLLCRGSWFRAEPDQPLRELFFRSTYASASAEQMVLAIERFGAAVRESFGLSN